MSINIYFCVTPSFFLYRIRDGFLIKFLELSLERSIALSLSLSISLSEQLCIFSKYPRNASMQQRTKGLKSPSRINEQVNRSILRIFAHCTLHILGDTYLKEKRERTKLRLSTYWGEEIFVFQLKKYFCVLLERYSSIYHQLSSFLLYCIF